MKPNKSSLGSDFGKTNGSAALDPLTPLLEQLDALETLKDASLGTYVAGFLEAGVLGHG